MIAFPSQAVIDKIRTNCSCLPSFSVVQDLDICRGKNLFCAVEWMQNIGNEKLDERDSDSDLVCQLPIDWILKPKSEVSLYGWPVNFDWIHRLYLCWIGNSFPCLVKSKPVKQEVSRTVILPPIVSVLCKIHKTNHIRFGVGMEHRFFPHGVL